MINAKQLYEETVRNMPLAERLRLATLILEEVSRSAGIVEFRDEWSDEDLRDATVATMRLALEDEDEEPSRG